MKHACTSLLLALFCASGFLWAGEPEEPRKEDPFLDSDTFDLVESSTTVGASVFQLETSFQFTTDRPAVRTRRDTYAFPTLLRGGVTERIELQLGSSGPLFQELTNPHDASYSFSDLDFGIKWHALDGDWETLPSVGFSASTALTVDGSTRLNSPSFTASLGWELPLDLSFDTSLSVGHSQDFASDTHFTYFVGATALGIPLTSRLYSFVGFAATIPASRNNHGSVTADAGLRYLLTDNVQIDFAVSQGVTKPADDFTATIGVTVRWGK